MSVIAHEVSHGYAADSLGDPTARYAGRLTIDPRAHIDPVGTIIMPLALGLLSGGRFLFAYDKPVPFNPYNLRYHKWGPALVGIAGPLANFLLALSFALLIRILPLTNFSQIRKRIDMMLDLLSQKEKGELGKYTKKERILIDRKIEKLQRMFGGIKDMIALPKALFIVDPRFEETALREAVTMRIPVVALCGSDNDITDIDYPVLANDSNMASVKYFVGKIAEAYKK